MFPYVAVLIGATALSGVSAFVTRRFRDDRAAGRELWTPFDVIAVALLVSFSALRFQVGTDYNMYARYFGLVNPADDWWAQIGQFDQEVGYTWLALVVKSASDSPHAMFWVTSVLTIVPMYAAIRKQTSNLVLSVGLYILLGFYLAPFNTVRQGIAVALNFWAYSFLGRRTWLFVLLNVVAALFHSSAAVAAVVQLVARFWKPTTRTVVLALGAGSAVAFLAWSTPFVSGLLETLNPRYVGYIAEADTAGVGTYLLIAANVVFLFLLLRDKDARPDWVAFVSVGVFFLILGTQSVPAARMFSYFGVFAVLAIPAMLDRRESGVLRGAVVVGAVAYFVAYLFNYGGLLPYQTYL